MAANSHGIYKIIIKKCYKLILYYLIVGGLTSNAVILKLIRSKDSVLGSIITSVVIAGARNAHSSNTNKVIIKRVAQTERTAP
jgi:hypothetical protein